MARHNTGTYMGLQIRDPNGGVDKPVPGYGLQFDTYQYVGCDPLEENYVAIIEDVICSSAKVYRPFANVDDNPWHAFEFTYTNRHIECTLDGTIVHGFVLENPDYTYTEISFGAGTGSSFSDQVIDDFQIWVDNGE